MISSAGVVRAFWPRSSGTLELDTDAGGVEVLVAGRDDLIAMKRAGGRPIDRSDIVALTDT